MSSKKIMKDLFDQTSWLMYNKKIAKLFGVYSSIIIGVLISKENYWERNREQFKQLTGFNYEGEFFVTREQLIEDTSLSEHEQRSGENKLKEVGIIDIKRKGLPSKNYYSINYDQLSYYLSYEKADTIIEDEQLNDNSSKILTYIHENNEPICVKKATANKIKEQDQITIIINKGDEKYNSIDTDNLEEKVVKVNSEEKVYSKKEEKINSLIENYSKKYEEKYNSNLEYKTTLFKKLSKINSSKIDLLYSNLEDWFNFVEKDEYVQNKTDKRLFIISNVFIWDRFLKYIKQPKLSQMKRAWDIV